MEPPDGPTLESWRQQVASAKAVAFAAVGTRPLLDALANAVATGDKWASTSAPNDRWPEADSIGGVRSAERRLSIAYRVADAARALETSHELAVPGSVLAARLSALDGAYSLDRVVATSRVRGACLRIDARAGSAETSPLELARAISVVDDETRRALAGRVGQPSSLDDAVVRPAHPAEAAAAAAWRALVGKQPGGATRRAVSWQGPTSGREREIERATLALDGARQGSSVERRLRVEAGQGELWALVASPCGTASESSDDAGVHDGARSRPGQETQRHLGCADRTLGDSGRRRPARPRLALEPRRDARASWHAGSATRWGARWSPRGSQAATRPR